MVVALGGLSGLRGEAADALLRARDGGRPAPADIVVVGIDPRSTQRFGRPPLPRSVYARAIRQFERAGVRAIGIDVQFTSASTYREDLALLEAVEGSEVPIVLATSQVVRRRVGGRGPVVADTDVLGGQRSLRGTRATAAHSSFPLASDGKFREAVATIDGLPTFAHALAGAAGGPGIPAGGMLLDPVLPASKLRHLSLADVVDRRFGPDELRGRIAIVGMTAVGPSGDSDTKRVAGTNQRVYGVEIQAQAVATALAGAPLSPAPAVTAFLAIVAALLSVVAAVRRRLDLQVGIVVTVAVLVPLTCWIAVRAGWLVDPILPWLVLAFGGGAGIAHRAAEERRARALARSTLSRFVPPAVVDDLLRDGSDGRLPPQARTATVMFCDLRGYTALTAGLARPEALVDVLDAYLGTVSRVVYANGGTVVSFQGDGVMTAFGVPIDDGRAAQHAVDAARELLDEALPALRAELAAALGDGPAHAIALGIGIATGPVFAGTVGPATRREYAVVGPTTNLAARLQARTKEEAGPVLIDDATAAAVMGEERVVAHTGVRTPEGPLVPLGPREIRGLSRAIDCWTLAS